MTDSIIITLMTATVVANLIGSVLVVATQNSSQKRLFIFTSLAAGFLFAITIIELIPTSLSTSEENVSFIVSGFVFMYLLHHIVGKHSHSGDEIQQPSHYNSLKGIFFGMLVHSFFDGIAVASGFEIDIETGVLIFISIFLHKIPDGLTMSSISLMYNSSRKKALLAGIYLCVSTLIGVFTVFSLQTLTIWNKLISVGFGFSGGVLLFVSIELLSSIQQKDNRKNFVLVVIGIMLVFASHLLL